MEFTHFSVIGFLGALAIFIYGIRLMSAGIQLLAGDRLRVLISQLTRNRFIAVFIGAFVTLILQSSNATTIALVGFAASGTLVLSQAIGVLLGAGIGTTLVVFLLAIKEMANYSLIFLIVGILIDISRKGRRSRYISMIFIGLGFIFFGMKLMVSVSAPLESNALLQQFFAVLASRPIATLLLSALFTVFVQNSATPIGLAIALSFSGFLTLETAVPMVLGANIGTCSGGVFASIGSNIHGKRVAVANLIVKIVGATCAVIWLPSFLELIQWSATTLWKFNSTPTLIALSHFIFNALLVIVFLPVLSPAAWLIKKLLPESHLGKPEAFRPRYLDKKSLAYPSLAFANVRREILRMLDIVQAMFENTATVLNKNDRILLESIQSQDDEVDLLDREIKLYLARLSQSDLTEAQANMELHLIAMTSKIEEIGDVVNRNILELADKKIRKARKFSEEGWNEIRNFHQHVKESFQLAAASLSTENESLARQLLRHHAQLAQSENDSRQEHIMRLHEGRKETLETSSIHLDLISNFYRVNELLTQLIREAYPKIY